MSAWTLRRASALMRERAEAASDGPWTNRRGPAEHVIDGWDMPIATVDTRENRRHIASWHPEVALAVADWLDNVSEHAERYSDGLTSDALAVAHAYLGESA